MNAQSHHRIEVIDVLRGFALLCILLVHYSGEFAGWSSVYTNPVSSIHPHASPADKIVNFALNLFLINKARSLFSFLFGVGFYFQLAKASRGGYRIESRFAKRMGALFLIGVLHAYLVWAGDILRFYAIIALLLLLVYRQSARFLFCLAIICSVLVPALSVALHFHFPFTMLTGNEKGQIYQGFTTNKYTDFLRANLLRDIAVNWDPYGICFYFVPVFGNFLFGYLAAQVQLFSQLIHNKLLLHRCLLFSFLTALFCSNSFVSLVVKLSGVTESDIPHFWRDLLALPNSLSIESMAFFLVCSVVHLYEFTALRKMLSVFSFSGRMTLTNYIAQSLFGMLFFFGLGLGFIGFFSPAAAFAIGLLYFAIQSVFSWLWLQYFTTGPVEYLWRSLAEGKWLSIRRKRAHTSG